MTENNIEVVDKIIDDKLQKELDAYRFFTDEAEFLWVPPPYLKSEVPKEDWPVVKIKCRDGLEIAKAEDELGYESKNNKLYTESGTAKIKAIKKYVIGWKNIKDTKGNEVKFMMGNDGVPDKLLKKMPPAYQMGIYQAINRQERLTETELAGLEF